MHLHAEGRMTERTLLLVDDEENILASLARLLRRDGYQILRAGSGKMGLEILAQNEVGVVVSDQRMPEMNGVEFLSQVKELYPDTVRIVLSGYTDLNSVTDAINKGAIYKFLTKPWDDELLRQNIAKAFQHFEMSQENERLRREIQDANEELSRLNHELERRVEEKARELMLNMSVLQVSQEVLEHLPMAVVGVDANGMIAIANLMANQLFGDGGGSLLGDAAAARIPPALLPCATGGGEQCVRKNFVLPDGRKAHHWCHVMGAHSRASGKVLVVVPE